jgi:glycosyltransferase involved in cell wall biosynthesis
VWAYRNELTARGHDVTIINVKSDRLWAALPTAHRGRGPFDWVWCHQERMVPVTALWGRILGYRTLETTHRPVSDVEPVDRFSAWQFRRAASAPYHACLQEDLAVAMKALNPKSRAMVLPNATEVASYAWRPKGNGRAVCLGGVSPRKRQAIVALALEGSGVECDFIGPIDHDDDHTRLIASHRNYLGSWSRKQVAERLTDYSCLVLFSVAECHPLVVGEAMAAGLSVVVSPSSTANLDLSLPWVTVVERPRDLPAAVDRAIADNPTHRAAIRAYAEQNLGYGPASERLLAQLEEWKQD